MAQLRLAMDAAFWDLDVSSAQTLDGTVRFVPGEPAPLSTVRSSKTIRPQQLSFFRNAFPLGILPSLSPPPPSSDKDLGSFALHSLLLAPASDNWWAGLVGQFRPKKLISNIKKEVMSGDEIEVPAFKDIAKHILDKSHYALGLFSQFLLTEDTSLLLNVERHGERKGRRTKATLLRHDFSRYKFIPTIRFLYFQLENHDITLEAAWPELFLDKKGTYWQVPASASLDIASLISPSGLRYRFGLHRNSGNPEALNSSSIDVPASLMPGVCAKAAFSYEKSRDIWRDKVKKSSQESKLGREPSSYDIRLQEPHATVSGIFGGTCAAWFGGNEKIDASLRSKKRHPFSADLFGSIGYSLQHGKFKKDFNDLTRIDARLDICSASSFIKGASYFVSDIFKGHVDREVNPLASPKLHVILQQQVAGPIVFRVDSRASLNSPSATKIPHVDDIMYALSYSLKKLKSGKILAWYSPKRKEAMVELRFFKF